MQLQTKVDIKPLPFKLTHKEKYTFIGSCFAENIGNKFKDNRFNALVNPFGVLYNPASISKCLDAAIYNQYDESLLIEHNNIWNSFLHHGSFSNTSRDAALQNIKEKLEETHNFLKETYVLFLTFGTANIYEYNGDVVANCHKIPAKEFTRRRLTVAEISKQITDCIAKLRSINPKIKVIISVSPVRYAKDGLTENNLSKASLLLATENVCKLENVFYFPAYEIIIDELRDYRFFAEDMTHPNPIAVNYIWEKIENNLLDENTINLIKQISKIVTATQHRPFNTDPEAHLQFLNNMYNKTLNLQKQYPYLNLSDDLKYFSRGL